MTGRILIIDDYGPVANGWSRLLGAKLDVSVTVALEQEEAYSLLRQEIFDLIVTGFYFSESPLDEGFRRIMSAARHQGFDIPVIFMAQRVSPHDAFEVAKLGASDFLFINKSSDPSLLVNAVRSGLELRQIPKLFLSYTGSDKPVAEKLARELQQRGWQVWYDDWEIKVGDSLAQGIEEGITSSAYFVLLLSRASTQSKWVREEVDAAFVRQLEVQSIKILPALLEQCTIPALLRGRRYADFRQSFDRGLRDIVRSVKASAQPEARTGRLRRR